MHSSRRVLSALAFSIPLLGAFPAGALAGSSVLPSSAHCPSGTVCNSKLGVAVTLQPHWRIIPAGKMPPGSLAFERLPRLALQYDVRLIIEPYAVSSVQNNAQAAQIVATKLVRAERARSVSLSSVRCGGSAGILLRGLPGGPGPIAEIVLAHHGDVYLIMAPGARLAPDQGKALNSLRFIPRTGSFLPGNARGGR